MLIHPTVERLRSLGLAAMADALIEMQNNPQAAEMPHADWLGLLIDREATFRDNRRLSRRLTVAKLRQTATIENIDYRTARGLDRSLFQALTTNQWIREHNHLAIVGPTGTGKSWLACALGNKACRDGFSVLYKRASRLFADLAQARGEGRLSRLMTTLERCTAANWRLGPGAAIAVVSCVITEEILFAMQQTPPPQTLHSSLVFVLVNL
jgi:DNA replication protein DnaC